MDYLRFGSTGLKVSRICLGCMSYGQPTEREKWALDEEAQPPVYPARAGAGHQFL